jgi:hypothetical protein
MDPTLVINKTDWFTWVEDDKGGYSVGFTSSLPMAVFMADSLAPTPEQKPKRWKYLGDHLSLAIEGPVRH